MAQNLNVRSWIGRCLIGTVVIMNLQAAVAFSVAPARYAASFELFGAPGESAVLGMAVLFLMWSVPYVVALVHPARHRVSLLQAIAMQGIGLVGETLILLQLPLAHATARASLIRFILFDGAGLAALLLAGWILRPLR